MKNSEMPPWRKSEMKTCEVLDAEWVGGPGREDCRRGELLVENKDYERALRPGDVDLLAFDEKYVDNPLLICAPKGGYSMAAKRRADELSVGLSRCRPARARRGGGGLLAGALLFGGVVALLKALDSYGCQYGVMSVRNRMEENGAGRWRMERTSSWKVRVLGRKSVRSLRFSECAGSFPKPGSGSS